MSMGHCSEIGMDATPSVCVVVPATDRQPLHRLASVRRQQGVSRRTVARVLNIDVEEVRQQEDEYHDLPLSTLYAWREILDVPVAELLVEPDDGMPPAILLRSQLVRLMKTVQLISEQTRQESVRRMAQTMAGQLVEIMPELKDVGAWVTNSSRREFHYGAAAHRQVTDGLFGDVGGIAHFPTQYAG